MISAQVLLLTEEIRMLINTIEIAQTVTNEFTKVNETKLTYLKWLLERQLDIRGTK